MLFKKIERKCYSLEGKFQYVEIESRMLKKLHQDKVFNTKDIHLWFTFADEVSDERLIERYWAMLAPEEQLKQQ